MERRNDISVADKIDVADTSSAEKQAKLTSVGIIERISTSGKNYLNNSNVNYYILPPVLFIEEDKHKYKNEMVTIMTNITTARVLTKSFSWNGVPNASCVYFNAPDCPTKSFSRWSNGDHYLR